MFPKLSLASVAIAISLITPARAFDQAQIEFVASFAASIVAANRCKGFALNLDEVTFVSSALGIKPEDWKRDQFKEAVKCSRWRHVQTGILPGRLEVIRTGFGSQIPGQTRPLAPQGNLRSLHEPTKS
jgi:hypothetical protein